MISCGLYDVIIPHCSSINFDDFSVSFTLICVPQLRNSLRWTRLWDHCIHCITSWMHSFELLTLIKCLVLRHYKSLTITCKVWEILPDELKYVWSKLVDNRPDHVWCQRVFRNQFSIYAWFSMSVPSQQPIFKQNSFSTDKKTSTQIFFYFVLHTICAHSWIKVPEAQSIQIITVWYYYSCK